MKVKVTHKLKPTDHNANNVAERLRKMSIRFSVVIHTYNVLSHSWD